MTIYADQIRRIQQATTLEDIRSVVSELPAKAGREGGVLYSGWIGSVRAESIALEISKRTGLPIINETPRARFLSDDGVRRAIEDGAERIFRRQGQTTQKAAQFAEDFLYGNPDAPAVGPVSVKNCLWGEASREFASSLRGQVSVIASAADAKRVLAQVEIQSILDKGTVESLAGEPPRQLQMLHAKGDVKAVLSAVQAQFSDAANKGIYTMPDHPGAAITQVSVSKEVAEALGLDADKFIGGANLHAAGLVPASVGPRLGMGSLKATGMAVSLPGAVVNEAITREAAHPGLGRGLGLVAAATVAYDLVSSADRASSMLQQGNHTGAASEVVHFGARNLGMWGGAVLGAEVFGTAGAETGPLDVVVGGAGALVGAIAGDKLADALDRQRIYHQSAPDGSAWTYDPARPAQGWTCTTSELDTDATRLNDGFPVYRQHSQTADAALADRLNYQASNTAVELALANPPRLDDPYTQPAAPGDTHSIRDAPWTRDPQTHAWTRRVVHGLLEHGMVNARVERAPAARATELDRAAEKTIAANAAQSPEAIASRYESAYRDYGWEKHGPLPEIVATTLHAARSNAPTMAHAHIATPLAHPEPPVATPVPTHLTDFRQGDHPLHAFYERALAKVHDMEDRYQMPYGMHSERLAAAMTTMVAAYNIGKGPAERFGALERIDLRGEGEDRQVVAIDQRVNYHLPQVQVSMPADKAIARSVEQSSQEWARRHMPHLGGASPKAPDVAAPIKEALPGYDPRRPDNPRHAQFEALRGKVAEAYAQAGIPRGTSQLDQATAAVLLHTWHDRVDGHPMQVSLLADSRTGVVGPGSDLLLQQAHGTLTLRTRVPAGELQVLPDQAFRQAAVAVQPGPPQQELPQAQLR